jgi:hypothetical protein
MPFSASLRERAGLRRGGLTEPRLEASLVLLEGCVPSSPSGRHGMSDRRAGSRADKAREQGLGLNQEWTALSGASFLEPSLALGW